MSRARPSFHRLAPRPRFASLALLSALALGSACKGESPEPATPKSDPKVEATTPGVTAEPTPPAPTGPVANTTDTAPIADHGDVVATAQLPSGTQLSDIAAVVETIQPGASMMIKLQLPKLLEQAAGFKLDDAKLDGPISVVVLNPSAHPQPLAVLVEAKDSAALIEKAKAAGYEARERDGRLLIGPATVVAAAEDFAFTHLSTYPDHSEFIVYPGLLLTAYASQIEQGLGQLEATMAGLPNANEASAKMIRSYAGGLIALGKQTERVVFSVGAQAGSADLITRMYPVDGSVFASFVAAQVPADHGLLAKLPASAEQGMKMVMSGDIRAGGARDALVNFAVEFMGSMYGSMSLDEWHEMMKLWLDNLDGSFAVTMTMNLPSANGTAPMDLRTLMGTTDSDALRTAWRKMLAHMVEQPTVEMMGMKVETQHQLDALEHDGVKVDLYTTSVDMSSLPPEQRKAMEAAGSANQKLHMATFDKVAAMATANDQSSITALIDASRGRGETFQPSADFSAALATSKARGDSGLMYFDMSGLPGAGTKVPFQAMAMSLGKAGDALSMRISLRK